MTTTTEVIHLRKQFRHKVTCGITGRVRITERLSEATCPRCQYDGDPVKRTRKLQREAAHAEALTEAFERAAAASLALACSIDPAELQAQIAAQNTPGKLAAHRARLARYRRNRMAAEALA